jgi:hypothetical protein
VGVVLAATATMAHADVNSQLASLQSQVNQLQSQVNSSGNSSSMGSMVGVNSNLSWKMMSNYSGVGKEMNLLKARQTGSLSTITLGGDFQADATYDNASKENTPDLSPTFANPQIQASSHGTDGSALQLTTANLSTTVAAGNWVTGYLQVGQSNIGGNALEGNAFGIQDAYLVFGNLSKAPFYGFVGNKDIDFGSFATVDMYNSPLTRTLFQAQGNTAGVGFNGYGFNGTASIMNGGNQLGNYTSAGSVIQSSNLYSANGNLGSNFALNASYGMTNGGVAWNLGAGYINASQFQTTNAGTNGAWDLNGKVSAMGFDLLAEYVSTISAVNATNATRLGGTTAAQAWDVGADYNFAVMGYKSVVNADYSQAYLGANNDLQAYQFVLGYRVQPVNNVWTGLEYAYSQNIAGGSGIPTPGRLPAVIAGNGVHNNTVTLDVTAMF